MDLIFRDANVFDGTDSSAKINDVAIKSGSIVEVGPSLSQMGKREIDAGGLSLMPGIIDTHTHYDAQLCWDSKITPSSSLGVTTVIIGNCGFTIAPCRPRDRNLVMQNLTQVEGMSIASLREGIDWDFETFPDYLNYLENKGTVANVGAFIGHSSIRTYVMGANATKREANDSELKAMVRIVEDGMAAGAIGFATSTAPQHNGQGGVPMPSRFAGMKELKELAKAMGRKDQGIFMLTRGEKTDIAFLESLSAECGRPVMIAAILHNSTKPDAVFQDLAAIGAARRRGHELWGQVSCCPLTNDFTFKSAYPLEGLTSWKPAMSVDGGALKSLYMNESFRTKVKEELAQSLSGRLFNGEWDKVELIEVRNSKNKSLEGLMVDELAREAKKDPLDWVLDFSVSENLESIFTAVLLNSDETAVRKLLCNENSSVALSDAGAHLTFFCDAGFGLHLMGHWSRDLKALPLHTAVYELTLKPATIFRVPKRGKISPGYYADLLLFDPKTVARGGKYKVYDLPGGGSRLTTDAIGIYGTWVNGVQTCDENGLMDNNLLPGKVLRRFV